MSGGVAGARPSSLGFSLNFLSGQGLLALKERAFGPFQVKALELEIPDIAFPFDVTGGADRFKSRRCALRHLVFGIDNEGLNAALRNSPLVDAGFQEIKAAVRDGYIELAGRFAIGDHEADFTFRGGLLVRSQSELHVVFYDTRVYGWLPVPSALLPVYLKRALSVPFETDERAGIWRLRPIDQFLRGVLPIHGWKIPDNRHAALVTAECSRDRVMLVAGPESEPNVRQIKEREPDKTAIIAAEGIGNNLAAEEALGRGAIHQAYDRYRQALYDERGGAWARMRLLQIGASDPELTVETRTLAEEVLAQNKNHVQALLAIASIAIRERAFGDAAARYAALAELARTRRERFDAIAAELAAAQASTPIDPGGALAAYERAAARARDSVVAHEALFRLRRTAGDWEGSVKAGERLVKLEPDPLKRAAIHRQVGTLCRNQIGDLKRARLHFERALRITPDDPGALEGLAETYAARGEPARAASYIARLTEQAEESGDLQKIASLNLRLGEIWERWLGDAESAAARYHRVLQVSPKNRAALLRLAALAETRGDLDEARGFYEDVLADEEESGDAEAIPDLVAAYMRLARVTLSSQGLSSEAVACLERAVELDPHNRTAREDLARLLRERGEWGRLLVFLEEWTQSASDPEEVRRAHLHAARVQLEQRRDRDAGRAHLENVLNVAPQDREALELILPLLEEQRDTVALTERLAAAADATTEPVRRAEFLFRLATARSALGLAHLDRISPLEGALDANPYHRDAARTLVQLLRDVSDPERLATGLGRLAVASESRDAKVAALLERSDILYAKLGRAADAEVVLRKALALAPEYVQGWIDLANLQHEQGHHAGARDTLRSVLEDKRLPAESHIPIRRRLAELAHVLNDPEDEVTHLEACMKAGVSDVADRLGEVLRSLGRQAELAGLLERWASEAEGERADELWFQAAEMRCVLGELDEAQSIYERLAATFGPVRARAALSLERLALGRDDFDNVARAIEVQIETAPATDQPPLFERLIDAHILRDDADTARDACLRLLEVQTGNAKARRFLAEIAEADGNLESVLAHLAPMLLHGDPSAEPSSERRDAFAKATALAYEIRPELVGPLRERFAAEAPGTNALARPLGAILAGEEKWDALLELRRYQLERDPGAVHHRRELAIVLHRHLDRIEDSVEHYEQVLQATPDDAEVELALVGLYEHLGRFADLGSLLATMSAHARDPEEALDYGLRAAVIYQAKALDSEGAHRALHALAVRDDVDPDDVRLLDSLKSARMHAELAILGERSLVASPDVDDGRFKELVGLYTGPLDDPDAAAEWCERMAEHFPDSDVAWRTWVDLLGELPQAGDVTRVLRTWANARDGVERAEILLELAGVAEEQSNDGALLEALRSAAEADPSSVIALTRLVSVYTRLNDYMEVLTWLGRLADLYEPGERRDEYLRHIIVVAGEDALDPHLTARSLEQLSQPTPSETAQLGRLYIEQADYERLAGLAGVEALFDEATLVHAAQGLVERRHFEPARRYFERAMRDPAAQAGVWNVAAESWRLAGELAALARWRIAWSRSDDAVDPIFLRLTGLRELAQGGEGYDPAAHDIDLEQDFAAADLGRVEVAALVFEIARATGLASWVLESAAALEKLLPNDAPELGPVLRLRYDHEIEGGNSDAAVELAARMLTCAVVGADALLESALEAAGRVGELLEHLSLRAHSATGEAAIPIWARIAELHAQEQSWADTAQALAQIPPEGRELRWGELRYEAGVALSDPSMRAEGAEIRAELSSTQTERAEWLRVLGSLLWWELGREADGRAALRRAHERQPTNVPSVQADAELSLASADLLATRRQLEEGLAVLEGADTVVLWMELGDLCLRDDVADHEGAVRAIERAMELGTSEAETWAHIGEQARSASRPDLVARAYESAYAADVTYEAPFVAALETTGAWAQLVEVLRARGDDLEGPAAAARYERAASIARDQIADRELAVELFGEAVRATPSEQNLRETFGLAVELDQQSVIANLGPPLLERLAEDDPGRPEVLRRTVDALTEAGDVPGTRALRQELVSRGIATADDKLILGRLELPERPAVAAELLQAAAIEGPPDDRATLLHQAARAWHVAGNDDSARPLLLEAIHGGIDTTDAHGLALEIVPYPERVHSMQRFIELDGDATWDGGGRSKLRYELAHAYLQNGDAARSHELLSEARTYGKPEGWALLMEATLHGLNDRQGLAHLWMDEWEASDCPWKEGDLDARVSASAQVYREHDDAVGELRALEALTRLRPDDAEVRERLATVAAAVGDSDKFLEQVDHQLGRAPDAQARSSLALRYAPILEAQFGEADRAQQLLRKVFTGGPTLALADALRDRLLATEPEALVELLEGAVDQVRDTEAVEMLLRAARVVAPGDRDPARAHGIYRRVLERDEGSTEARAFCLENARGESRWSEVIELLELGAKVEPDGAHASLLEAADVAGTELEDAAEELRLVAAAAAVLPGDQATADRLLALQIAQGELGGARDLYLAGRTSTKTQIDVAKALSTALRKAQRETDAVAVLDWMADHHPHSLAASDHRMAQARDRGDNQALLRELEARIKHPATFDDAERAVFHAEAGRAALSLGERESALEHFVGVVEGGTLEAQSLFHGLTIAGELDDAHSREVLLDHAVTMRPAIAAAAEEQPQELQGEWLSLLGQVHERAGDLDAALAAHAAVIEVTPDAFPPASVKFLRSGYRSREEWEKLIGLDTQVASQTDDPGERGELLYQVGVIQRERLGHDAAAGRTFLACLEVDPGHHLANLTYGMMLSRIGEHQRAMPLLLDRVDVHTTETSTEDLLSYSLTLRRSESWERALDVNGELLSRDSSRVILHSERAEILEALGHREDAEVELKTYADLLGGNADPNEIAPIRRRLARSALARGDQDGAAAQLVDALRLQPDSMEIVQSLREVYETLARWQDAAELRLREAAAATEPEKRIAHYRELARIHRHELGDFTGAALMMERASAAAPDDATVMRELMELHEAAGNWPKFMAVAERILAVAGEGELDAPFFAGLALAYEMAGGDAGLAKDHYGRAIELDPGNMSYKDKYRELARAAGHWEDYARVEAEAIGLLESPDEQAQRLEALTEVYLRELQDLKGAIAILEKARTLRPEDRELTRRLADTYALDERTYTDAARTYGELLELDPLSAEVIRIRARLAGQMGDTDRAYGFYAALLALSPSDDEAREYVTACRGARPAGPRRAVVDADRARGLIHPDQSGPIEELFARLARFAELTRPGDLAGRGLTEGDRLAHEDERAVWIAHVLVPLGLEQYDLLVHRGGGYACEAELVGSPVFLIGSSLADTAAFRERSFLVARTAELYRTGHALCDKLSAFELGGLLAALCVAIEPSCEPPGGTFETVEWAQTISAHMNDDLRAAYGTQVLDVLAAAAELDVARWQQACRASAGRLALLLSCDIAEAIDGLMHSRGFDDLTEEQRVAVLREAREDIDLFSFALSDAFFELRESLGLALRTQ